MIRYYCKTTRSNRTYNFPLSLIYDRIKINSVPFHRSVSLHRETTRREFIYFKLARFLPTYMLLFTFRRRYTTASNFIYKSPWNLPFETVRVRRGSWTDTITSFHTTFVSLYCVATIAQSLVPGERPSQLRATVRHSFFPSVSCFGSLLDKQKQSTKNFLPVARRWTTSTTVVCLWPATSNRFV